MHRIIVVDDDEGIRNLYRIELEDLGYKVDMASNITETMGLLREGDYHLMILDIRLEGESGLELLQGMTTENIDIPVIISSVYSCYKMDFSSWLADGYVIKSSDLTELTSEVERVIDKHYSSHGRPES
jgi:DNA-binding NtrC family response regulator